MNRGAVLSPLTGARHWARNDPGRVAVIDGKRCFTYGELNQRVDAAASYFFERGVKRGSIVGMSMRNALDAMVIPLAAAALGAQISPVNFRLRARELRAIVEQMNAQVFIFGEDLAPAIADCGFGEPQGFVALDSFDRAVQKQVARPAAEGFQDASEPYTLMWTSGTRGNPKPCRGSLAARMNWIVTLPFVYGIRESDRYLAALPLVHSAGMTFALAHLFFGACVYPVPRFDAGEAWRLLREEALTSGLLVPTMLQMLVEEDPDRRVPVPATLRTLITAGSRIRAELHAAILERFPGRLYTYYGSTESPSMTVLHPRDQQAHPDSVGRPYIGVEIDVRNVRSLADYEVPVGDIFARNPFAMDEYGVEGIPVPISADGWIETCDIGFLDDEGFLHVFGRASDVIISGGLNVSLPEIERVISAHSQVRDVAVVGIEDQRWGDVPAAVVVPVQSSDGEQTIESVRRHCRSELAGYKVPRTILAVDEIPRTASGKVAAVEVKALIRERMRAADTVPQ
ncbi:MAG: class I adenylate-forming enzyme family protein [Vulcanimicrobiaceae bacterium]